MRDKNPDELLIENCFIIHETEKAVLIECDFFDENQWVPKSVIHDNSEIWRDGQCGDLTIKLWFAEKQDWI